MVWRNVQRTNVSNIAHFISPIVSMSLDFDPMWEEIACQALTFDRWPQKSRLAVMPHVSAYLELSSCFVAFYIFLLQQ